MTTQTRSSYDELFERLDKNHDGRIDVHELIELLENVGLEMSEKKRVAMARKIIKQGSGSPEATSLSFQQFLNFIFKQEKKLRLVFRHVDADHHGNFDAKDLVVYFDKLGIRIDLSEAKN